MLLIPATRFADTPSPNSNTTVRRKLRWSNIETKSVVLCRLRQARYQRRDSDCRGRSLMRITTSSTSMKQLRFPAAVLRSAPESITRSIPITPLSPVTTTRRTRDSSGSADFHCRRARTTRRTASRAFSLLKQRSSTRQSSTRRDSSLNIKRNSQNADNSIPTVEVRKHLWAADRRWASRTARQRMGAEQQHFVCVWVACVEGRRPSAWHSHHSIFPTKFRRHVIRSSAAVLDQSSMPTRIRSEARISSPVSNVIDARRYFLSRD